LLLLPALLLCACGGSTPDPATFETDAGEAAVRHLISKLPPLNPGVAKSHSLVLGEITKDGLMTPATDAFVARFADLNLKFINAINLKAIEPGPIIVDNRDRLAAFVLQLRSLKKNGDSTWEAEVAWSYKLEVGRETIRLATKDGKITVVP
jgi:hypothetical protein